MGQVRGRLIRGVIATGLVLVSVAATGVVQAQTPPRVYPLTDFLPFWDRYLALPPASRDGFTLHYTVRPRDGGPMPRLVLIRDGRRSPLELGPDGRITPPTDLAVLRSSRVTREGTARGSVRMDMVPVLPLAPRIAITSITNSLSDYDAARSMAGPMAVAAPRFRAIVFPGTRAGDAELAGGRRTALPRDEAGNVYFVPGDRAMTGAVALVFAAAPTRAAFKQ